MHSNQKGSQLPGRSNPEPFQSSIPPLPVPLPAFPSGSESLWQEFRIAEHMYVEPE